MIKNRDFQLITSPYGFRKRFGRMHNGVDLRSYSDDFSKKLPACLPEECMLQRKVFQKKWGWTYVFEPMSSGYYELKFTHLNKDNVELIENSIYPRGTVIGFCGLTQYMKNIKLGEHLHFEVWESKKKTIDPIIYFDKMDIEYNFKGA